jgi:hypothetical protein
LFLGSSTLFSRPAQERAARHVSPFVAGVLPGGAALSLASNRADRSVIAIWLLVVQNGAIDGSIAGVLLAGRRPFGCSRFMVLQ